jgi:hypothetical protein
MDAPVNVWILRIRVRMLDQTPPPPAGAFGYPLDNPTSDVT